MSDVGKKKPAFWQRGQSFTRSSSCQPTDKRLSAQRHLALTRLLWITLFHSLFRSVAPFPPCSAYYHCAARREWFKTYGFRFKKPMLGLGRSLFPHLWSSGGSAPRLKKQVNSPLRSLMLCFTDSKLKRKPYWEINVSRRTGPCKTRMTDKVINMSYGQCWQSDFSPLQKVNHTSHSLPRKARVWMMTLYISSSQSVYSELKVLLYCFFQCGNCSLVLFGVWPLAWARVLGGRYQTQTLSDRCYIRPTSKELKSRFWTSRAATSL